MALETSSPEQTSVILGTATPGGGFPIYGDAVAEIVNAADASLTLQPKNTKGSTENVPMLEAGQLDIGLVQGEAIASVGSWSFILARPTLPEDAAYRLARALHRNEAALAARLPQACETTAANTLAAAPRKELIHPGVLRYLREIGLAQ